MANEYACWWIPGNKAPVKISKKKPSAMSTLLATSEGRIDFLALAHLEKWTASSAVSA